MPKFISDAEMASLESKQPKKKFISDAEMNKIQPDVAPEEPKRGLINELISGAKESFTYVPKPEGSLENVVPYAPGKAPLTAQAEQAQKIYAPTEEQIGEGLVAGAGFLPVQAPAIPLISKLPQRLKESAIGMKLKQAGAIFKDMKKLKPGEPEKLFNVMKKHKIAQAGDTFEDVLEKTVALKNEAGKNIGNVYKEYSSKITDPNFLKGLPKESQSKFAEKMGKYSLNPENLADEIAKVVTTEQKGVAGGREATKSVMRELQNLKDAGIKAKEAGEPFIDSLFEYRKSLDDKIRNVYKKLPKDRTPMDDAMLSVRNQIQKRIDDHLGALDEFLGTKELKKLKDANDTYKHMSKLSDLAQERVQREAGNRMFGLTELGVGGFGAGTEYARDPGDVVGALGKGLLFAGGAKLGRKYGPGLLSPTLEAASKVAAPITQLPKLALPAAGLMAEPINKKRGLIK